MKSRGSVKVNLGTGQSTTVKELIKAFEDANKMTIPYTVAHRRKGDVGLCYADVSLAKRLLDGKQSTQLKKCVKMHGEQFKMT